MAGMGLNFNLTPEAIMKEAGKNPGKNSIAMLEAIYGKQWTINYVMNNIAKGNSVASREQLDYLNAAWAAETDPARKRQIIDVMNTASAESSTPNNVNGNLSPDQMLDWLKTRQGVKDQLAALTKVESETELFNNQAKAGIDKNAVLGKTKSARNSAARGIANSSIRDTALADIDAGAESAKNDLDDRLAMTRAQNDIARSQAMNFWNQYDLALDAQRLLNASANADQTPPKADNPVKPPDPKTTEGHPLNPKVQKNKAAMVTESKDDWKKTGSKKPKPVVPKKPDTPRSAQTPAPKMKGKLIPIKIKRMAAKSALDGKVKK